MTISSLLDTDLNVDEDGGGFAAGGERVDSRQSLYSSSINIWETFSLSCGSPKATLPQEMKTFNKTNVGVPVLVMQMVHKYTFQHQSTMVILKSVVAILNNMLLMIQHFSN